MDLISRIRSAVIALAQYSFLYAYALPCLRSYRVFSRVVFVSRGYGSFILLDKNLFAKLAISNASTIDVEYYHYLALSVDPVAATLVPSYYFLKGIFVSALVCEILYSICHEDLLSHAVCVQNKLEMVGLANSRLTLADCPQIQAGLYQFEQEFGIDIANKIRCIANNYLAFGDYSVGLVHGDFHSRNLMIDAFGNSKLIDLDCIRYRGIRQFDPLYFALQLHSAANKLLWIDSLCVSFAMAGVNIVDSLSAFGISWSNAYGLAFCMDRIGQVQMTHCVIYPRSRLLPVVQALQFIDEHTL